MINQYMNRPVQSQGGVRPRQNLRIQSPTENPCQTTYMQMGSKENLSNFSPSFVTMDAKSHSLARRIMRMNQKRRSVRNKSTKNKDFSMPYDVMNISNQKELAGADDFEQLKRRELKQLKIIFEIRNQIHDQALKLIKKIVKTDARRRQKSQLASQIAKQRQKELLQFDTSKDQLDVEQQHLRDTIEGEDEEEEEKTIYQKQGLNDDYTPVAQPSNKRPSDVQKSQENRKSQNSGTPFNAPSYRTIEDSVSGTAFNAPGTAPSHTHKSQRSGRINDKKCILCQVNTATKKLANYSQTINQNGFVTLTPNHQKIQYEVDATKRVAMEVRDMKEHQKRLEQQLLKKQQQLIELKNPAQEIVELKAIKTQALLMVSKLKGQQVKSRASSQADTQLQFYNDFSKIQESQYQEIRQSKEENIISPITESAGIYEDDQPSESNSPNKAIEEKLQQLEEKLKKRTDDMLKRDGLPLQLLMGYKKEQAGLIDEFNFKLKRAEDTISNKMGFEISQLVKQQKNLEIEGQRLARFAKVGLDKATVQAFN